MTPSNHSYTIVQLTLMDETGDSYYRMRWPAAELAQQKPEWRVINLDARSRDRYRWALDADLLIAYQSSDVDLLPILKKRRALGKKTLVEYNDNFYDPPAASPVAREWSSPLLWQIYETFMELSDGIIVTGPGLERLFKARHPQKPIYVLPNHFPYPPEPLAVLEQKKSTSISFGWAGSVGHIADFLAVSPVLNKLLKEFPDARLHVMGNESIPSLLRIPADRLVFTNWGSIHQYYEFWKPVQIGIAPLLNTPYNTCRSDIKAVEMAALAVAPILTRALPYDEFCAKTGTPTYDTPQQLEALLRQYISNIALARAAAARCHSYVSTERVGPSRSERLAVYEQYLPKVPTVFSGVTAIGYHEIVGALTTLLPSAQVMQEVQALHKSGKLAEAANKLLPLADENPDAADLQLARVRFLMAKNAGDARTALAGLIKNFPRDLRFQLLLTLVARDSAERRGLWENLVNALGVMEPRARRFFRREIVEQAIQFLRSDPQARPIMERLLGQFPEAYALRFCVAEALEVAGLYADATKHFEVLKAAVEAKGLNDQFLAGLEENYVQAWYEALKAREGLI